MPRSLTLAHPTALFEGPVLFLRENGWQSAMIVAGVVLIVTFI